MGRGGGSSIIYLSKKKILILGLKEYLASLACYLADGGTVDQGADSARECGEVSIGGWREPQADHAFVSRDSMCR